MFKLPVRFISSFLLCVVSSFGLLYLVSNSIVASTPGVWSSLNVSRELVFSPPHSHCGASMHLMAFPQLFCNLSCFITIFLGKMHQSQGGWNVDGQVHLFSGPAHVDISFSAQVFCTDPASSSSSFFRFWFFKKMVTNKLLGWGKNKRWMDGWTDR